MKKLIIVSKSYAYQNMTTCLLIDDYIENVEVVLFSEENKEQIMNKIVQEGFELVFIESGVLSFFPDFSSLPDSIKLFGYSEKGKEADIELFEPLGITTIGTFNLASDIVHYVDEFSEETIKSLSVKEDSKAKSPVIGEQKTEQRIETPKTQDKTPEKNDESCIFCPECGTQLKAYSKFCYNCGKKIGEISVTEEISERVTENDLAKAETEEEFRADSSAYKKKCKIIATYSAKGGVGKTTVATNLAAMLAMSVTAFAAGDVAGAVTNTWTTARQQIVNIVNNVVFPCLDVLLAILLFVKIGGAYLDYRKHGQMEWTPIAIIFGGLIFTLTAPLYIWTIV